MPENIQNSVRKVHKTPEVLDCPVGMNIRAHPLARPDLRCDHTEGPWREIALGHLDSEMGRLRAGFFVCLFF